MNDIEAKEMMNRCVEEIVSLRAEIGRLKPQAEAYQSVQQILSLLPRPSQGYGEDLVWRLKKRLEEMDKDKINGA